MAFVVTALLETNGAWPFTSWQLFSRLRGPTQATCRAGEQVAYRISLDASPPTTVVVSREPSDRC